MSELRKLREAVYDLATAEDEVLTDEQWYDRLWKLLDPVIDARAGEAIATYWAASSTETPPAHVDTSGFEDPDNG